MQTDMPIRRDAVIETSLHAGERCRVFLLAATLFYALVCVGCSTPRRYGNVRDLYTPERLECGYTLILPGAMGSDPLEHGITRGLLDAKLPMAIDLYDWTEGPTKIFSNLRSLERNSIEAEKIAQKILHYQDRYPGRPVQLIGYSGGGAVAVMALEALPENRKVTGAILVAPTLTPEYDLRHALSRTELGIHHFYSSLDVPVLMMVISTLGTSDGHHRPAAGALGFKIPPGLDDSDRQTYSDQLFQHPYTLSMLRTGHIGGHFSWMRPAVVQAWLAPLVAPTSQRHTIQHEFVDCERVGRPAHNGAVR